MGKLLMKGGKKKKKRPGLGKVKPKHVTPRKKDKKKKKKKKQSQSLYTIRQPNKKKTVARKRKYNKPRQPKQPIQSFSMIDSSTYSNVMGEEDYKRKMRQHRYDDGRESGIIYDQDNDQIIIERYPK